MKAINLAILCLGRNLQNFCEYKNSMAECYKEKRVKKDEIETLMDFVKALSLKGLEMSDLDNFFYGFAIPQISKEFDLLKIYEDGPVVNIELKSREIESERIEYQLKKNRYYLSHLNRKIYTFCYIKHQKVYLYDGNNLEKVSIDNIVKLIKCSKRCIQNNIEKLFAAKDYLISPINMPVKFLHESYYLTAQQEEIKNKIINGIRSGEQKIWGICGTAGTGKTLLLYDIARTLGDEMKVCIIHSGILSQGHIELKSRQKKFDIISVSQGNIAMSLVPIIRGRSLMLVGDPQQLSPVILLNPVDNEKLKRIYGVTDEYDYIKNSIYKTYLACDAVSEEILLSHHYRCNKKIISFNNKKYYNNKLIINSPDKEANPLIFKNIPANTTNYKNTAPQEVEEIISFIKENPDKSIGIITPFTNQKELIQHALKENGMENIPCGTVHAFQGDEKDVVLFSLAITQQTYQGTYDWLKNNKELINVATSRAKDQLVILSDIKELKRLHSAGDDDIYELVDYVQTNGEAQVTARETSSRALGIKPYSTQTEAAFLTTLNHALDNVLNTNNRCVVQREVSIAHVFQENESYDDLFYTGRFDFVVYEKGYRGQDMPILAIELDGKEHKENAIVRARDEKKNAICRAHGFELIRVENSYARRYNYIKNILIQYFKSVR